jgi:hypothetical protein
MKLAKYILVFAAFPFIVGARYHQDFINGREAAPGDFPEVVFTTTGGIKCTGTLVGPRVLLTAATCGRTGDITRFQVGQTLYSATITRSPIFDESSPDRDHDVALGLIDKDVTEVAFASVGGTADVGTDLTLAGYGCVTTNGEGGHDGILRFGDATVRQFAIYDMISNKQGGGALCFGDFGGPTYLKIGNPKAEHHFVVGVNSKGNLKDTNWSARLDIPESKDFLRSFADLHQVSICGINKECASSGPSPGPGCAEQLVNLENAKQLLNIRMNDLVSCTGALMNEVFE